MTILLGLFLVCICVDCQSGDTDFYRPNAQYDCTQNCSTTVEGTQRSCDTEQNSLCRCDRDCRTYGDCCANYGIICDEAANQLDGLLQCRRFIWTCVQSQTGWSRSGWCLHALQTGWQAEMISCFWTLSITAHTAVETYLLSDAGEAHNTNGK